MAAPRRAWQVLSRPPKHNPSSGSHPISLLWFRGAAALLAVFSLAGCNRPAAEPPPNLLATSVAATLTAQPATLATSTLSAPTPTPTEAALATPTEGPTETAAAPPTPSPIPLSPDDPRAGLNLSAPDVRDDFNQALWYVGSDAATASFAYADGRFQVTDNLADGFLWWSTTAREAADLYLEVTAEVGACSGKDAYGFGIRVGGQNFDQGYTLEISCDGAYRVRRFVSEEPPVILLDWTPAAALVSGSEATNRIGLLAQADQIRAFANGELLSAQAIEDDSYSSGALSIFASAAHTPGLTVYYDDLALWFLSP
ncbi:MAG: hypothetical protein ACRDHG_02270 [Anaerolineales bacterium]